MGTFVSTDLVAVAQAYYDAAVNFSGPGNVSKRLLGAGFLKKGMKL